MPENKVKVLVVDDSTVVRSFLCGLLNDDPGMEVIGTACNGKEAIAFLEKERPDVVTMDIEMPEMDGFEATRQIMQRNPLPIVFVSGYFSPEQVSTSFKALELGAVAILSRPPGPGHPDFLRAVRNFTRTIKNMSEIRVVTRRSGRENLLVNKADGVITKQPSLLHPPGIKVIAIGASAGGPIAIRTILAALPSTFPIPILMVQHIDASFAEGFAEWLNQHSTLPVNLAKDGERLLPGHIYLPPGDRHLGLWSQEIIRISNEPAERNLRPSVNYLFRSVRKAVGKQAIGILLSGMGTDGAAELKEMRNSGCITLVQDAGSSLVHGMPGAAIKQEAAVHILSPENIAGYLLTKLV